MKQLIPRRTHTCGELTQSEKGSCVLLTGWVHKLRNLGALVFIDIRDRWGITQAVFDLRFTPEDIYEKAKNLRLEDVIAISGQVEMRENPNPNLKTGLIEIQVSHFQVLSKAQVTPFPISDDTSINEELRLQYRYLDMRKSDIIPNLLARHKAMQAIRQCLSANDFIEITTPILGKSTPEGARDYLVPSRVHHGEFYALPQSPQMFKQILMVGGLDRYFQIATCFRDEDLRADRQPEFQQIDIEMSFGTSEDLFPIIEGLVQTVFKEVKNVELPTTFPRMTYRDAIEKYGTDKPDLRFGMPIVNVSHLTLKTDFTVFHEAIHSGGVVCGLNVKQGALLSRKEIEEYTKLVSQFGFKGLAWLKYQKESNKGESQENSGRKLHGPITKFIHQDQETNWIEEFESEEGDLILIIAGHKKRALQGLDHLRRRLGKDLGLIKDGSFAPLWVVDFPLFAWNEEENRIESEHHPFTSPHLHDLDLVEKNPLHARSSSYDLVLNGYEIASGSQRIHDSELQETIFTILGMSPEERQEKFGFFIEALQYGTPPHLGIALGLDRIIMILIGTENIRDVIAFPKNQKAVDLMMQAPSNVQETQLKELCLRVTS